MTEWIASHGFASSGAPSALKHVLLIGEALSPSLVESAQRLLPGTTFHNLYGPTEANFTASECLRTPSVGTLGMQLARTVAFKLVWPAVLGRSVPRSVGGVSIWREMRRLSRRMTCETAVPARMPVGRACGNTTIYVVVEGGEFCEGGGEGGGGSRGGEHGGRGAMTHFRLAPIGEVGEVCIGGRDAVAEGYLNLPELTASKFVEDPFLPHGKGGVASRHHPATARRKMYRTGDRARWTFDGQLEFLGRIDRQVKLRGFRIELGEVESALRAAPGVVASAVVLRTSDPAALVGFVEPLDVDPLLARAHCRRSLPSYMVPALIYPLEELPRLPNGKIHLRSLATIAGGEAVAERMRAAAAAAADASAKYGGNLEAFLQSGDASALAEAGVDSMGLVRLFQKAFPREMQVRAIPPHPNPNPNPSHHHHLPSASHTHPMASRQGRFVPSLR